MTGSTEPALFRRDVLRTVVATAGFGLNAVAWVLVSVLAPYLEQRYKLGPVLRSAVVAVPLVVGSLGRIPVGALTDRYGARLMFPLVSLVSAGSVAMLAYVGSVGALLLVCCALGVGGTAFAVGAAMLVRTGRPRSRGFTLSVFGAGGVGAALGIGVGQVMDHPAPVRAGLLLIAAVLAGYAVVAAIVIRDRPVHPIGWSPVRDTVATLRSNVVRHWAVLYAVTLGGLVAMVVYLPTYLHREYRLGWSEAVLDTAVFVAVAALARPVGGWLCDRADPVRILVVCFAGTGLLGVVLAFQPPLPVSTTTFLGVGIGLGVANGTLLALIGRTVPGDRAGLITGVVGAAGGLGGFVPPIVLSVVEELDGSYALGLMILADVVLAAALHLRAHRDWIGDALAYPAAHPAPARLEETATTVVALSAADAAEAEPALLGTLADLAVRHELVIAYGHTDDKADQLSQRALLEALRARLPRYRVTAVYVDPLPRLGPAECELIEEMLNEGTLAVAVMPCADPGPTAEALAVRLGADNAMRLDYDPAYGARLRDLARPEAAIPG